jgi:hypothetical protein
MTAMTVGELRKRLEGVPDKYEVETSDKQNVVDVKVEEEGVDLVILEVEPGNYHPSRLKQK